MAFSISYTDAAGHAYALLADAETIVLGNDATGSPMFLSPGGAPGEIFIYMEDATRVVADAHGVRLSKDEATPFKLNMSPSDENRVMFVAPDGNALEATSPGKPISLGNIASANDRAWFHLKEVPDSPVTKIHIEKIQPEYAADEGYPFSEGHSTHLWIFNRAVELIMTAGFYSSPNRDLLRYYLGLPEFVEAVKRGIYAADNSGYFDKATSGFVFSAHFYNPETKKGAPWEPNPTGVNALNYGVYYFEAAVSQPDIVVSGRSLGLAIHYLQDLCQPMHSGLYGNLPPINWQHENYEQWILNIQDSCRLPIYEVLLNEFNIKKPADWYQTAATESFAVYKSWTGPFKTSPVGGLTPPIPKLDKAGANKPHPDWLPQATQMLKLAQRVTIGLLLDWAARPSVLVSNLLKNVAQEQLHIADMKWFRCIVAGDDGRIYHQASNGRPNARWILEPALDASGSPIPAPAGANDSMVYWLRDAKQNKYLVAGDTYDGNVYLQADKNRPNAMWTLEPVLNKDGTEVRFTDPNSKRPYAVFHIRDLKWRYSVVAGDKYDGHVYHQPDLGRSNAAWAIDYALLA